MTSQSLFTHHDRLVMLFTASEDAAMWPETPLAWALHLALGIPLGMFFANLEEWVIHKYVLHGLGKKKGSFYSFHWGIHHQHARKEDMHDRDYEKNPLASWDAPSKEIFSLATSAFSHLPFVLLSPGFYAGLFLSAVLYYVRHRKSHLDPAWARAHMPWHVDHHMGPNQDANWCVTFPWWDHILGTREYYVGTERERLDLERAAERKRRREAAAAAGQAVPEGAGGEEDAAAEPAPGLVAPQAA